MSFRDKLSGSGGRKVRDTEVDGYGRVHFREMTVAESMALAKLQEGVEEEDSEAQIRRTLAMVVEFLAEEDGSRVFAEDEREEGVELLMGQSISAAKGLIEAMVHVNGLSDEAVKAAAGN